MASGSGYTRLGNSGSSLSTNQRDRYDDNQYRQNKSKPYNRSNSDDPDEMTRRVVDDFKYTVQDKIRKGQTINESLVEAEIANLKRKEDPERYALDDWKKRLPNNLRNCSDNILRVSMAYGNDPNQVKNVLQEKMNQNNSNEDSADTSLNNLIGPLKRLKKDLDKNPMPNLFRAVRNINDRDTDRVDRLFLSEAHRLVLNLKDFTFDDAHDAAQAIRETDYESNEQEKVLPLIKLSKGFDDCRDYLKRMEELSTPKSQPGKKPSSIYDDDDDDDDDDKSSSSSHNHRSLNNQNQTSSYRYKPMPDPYSQPPRTPDRSSQGLDNTANRGTTRHHSPKN